MAVACTHTGAPPLVPLGVQVPGAGELLVAPLGAALTALGVLIYKHRSSIRLPAIGAASLLSGAVSVVTSVAAAKMLGVSAGVFVCVCWGGGGWVGACMARGGRESGAVSVASAQVDREEGAHGRLVAGWRTTQPQTQTLWMVGNLPAIRSILCKGGRQVQCRRQVPCFELDGIY